MKTCSICKREKSLSEFTKTRTLKSGKSQLDHRCKPCHNELQKTRDQRNRDLAIAALGGVCCRCGFSDNRALQIDHIDGGGSKERRNGTSHRILAKRIANGDTAGCQLLCANCNWIKRIENNECGRSFS